MEEIAVSDIKIGNYFTEDAYIFDYLFFLPKKTVVKDYHLDSLKLWNIDKVISSGKMFTGGKPSLHDTSPDMEKIFDEHKNIIDLPDESGNEASNDISAAKEIVSKQDSYKDVYKRWIMLIVSFFNSILTTKDVNKQNVINLLNDIEGFIKRDKDSVLLLLGQDIEGIPRVYRQSLDTVILSFIMAHSLSLSDFAKTNLVLGALFHDIGMLKVPKTILEKTGILTQEEIQIIHNHTIVGFNYIRDARYSAIIASGALQHHERLDGKGYPEKKTAEQITNIGKIVAVIDAYCAAISSKSFRNPIHAKEAVQDLLKLGGTAYDTTILKEFVKNISIYPIGSMVLLSNNFPAKVIGNSGVAMRPIVATIINGKDERIDLSKRIDIYIKGVYLKKANS